MQSFLEALRQIRQSYKGDPLYARVIKPSVQGIENASRICSPAKLRKSCRSSMPPRRPIAGVSILADAVDKGKNTEGVFTPAQLGMADRANAKKFDGKLSAASGESPFFDLQRAPRTCFRTRFRIPERREGCDLAARRLTGAGAGAGFSLAIRRAGLRRAWA
jgi:hypothetical protein